MKTDRTSSVLSFRHHVAVYLFFFLLGIAFTWPLGKHLTEGITGACGGKVVPMCSGDHLQYYYHMGLITEAITGAIPWFSNPLEFNFGEPHTGFFTYMLPVSLLYIPFTIVSDTIAYNMFMLIVFALGGYSMFLWTHELTRSTLAALVAGFFFNFAFYRQVELFGGQPGGSLLFLIPLTLFFLDRAISSRSPWSSVFAGITLLSLGFNNQQYAYYFLGFLIIYILWRVAFSLSRDRSMASILPLAITLMLFLLSMGLCVWWAYYLKSLMLSSSAISGGWPLHSIASASSPFEGAVDRYIGRRGVYLGIPVLLTICLGTLRAIFTKGKNEPHKWDIIFFTAIFAISYTLAFGITAEAGTSLYSLFHENIPYFSMIRNPAKNMMIALMSSSILIGYFTAWAVGKARQSYFAAGACLLLLGTYLSDTRPHGQIGVSLLDSGNKVYQQIEKEKAGVTLNVPLMDGGNAASSVYNYYAINSGMPMVNGYFPMVSASYETKVLQPYYHVNFGEFNRDSVSALKAMGVRYVVLHERLYKNSGLGYYRDQAINAFDTTPYLDFVSSDNGVRLYRFTDPYPDADTAEYRPSLGFLFEDRRLFTLGGSRVTDTSASDGKAIASNKIGYSLSGPFLGLPAGHYSARFRLKIAEAPAEGRIAAINVTSRTGAIYEAMWELGAEDIKSVGDYHDYTISFYLKQAQPAIEFHVILRKPIMVHLDHVQLTTTNTPTR